MPRYTVRTSQVAFPDGSFRVTKIDRVVSDPGDPDDFNFLTVDRAHFEDLDQVLQFAAALLSAAEEVWPDQWAGA